MSRAHPENPADPVRSHTAGDRAAVAARDPTETRRVTLTITIKIVRAPNTAREK